MKIIQHQLYAKPDGATHISEAGHTHRQTSKNQCKNSKFRRRGSTNKDPKQRFRCLPARLNPSPINTHRNSCRNSAEDSFSNGCTGTDKCGQKCPWTRWQWERHWVKSLRLPGCLYWVGSGDLSVLIQHCVAPTPRLWSTSPCCLSLWALVSSKEQKVIRTGTNILHSGGCCRGLILWIWTSPITSCLCPKKLIRQFFRMVRFPKHVRWMSHQIVDCLLDLSAIRHLYTPTWIENNN